MPKDFHSVDGMLQSLCGGEGCCGAYVVGGWGTVDFTAKHSQAGAGAWAQVVNFP